MMESEHGRIDLLTQEQIDWCNEHCDFEWFVEDDVKVCSKTNNVYFKNKETLISFYVDFGDCNFFICSCCSSLKSLEGAPESVNKNFSCFNCDSLETLKGASESVGGYFDCFNCSSLRSLEGAPKNIGEYLNCSECNLLKFIDELKNMKIKGKIYYYDCQKLKKYDFILSNMNVFRRWQKSDLSADEFLKEWNGYLEAKKYGI